MKQPEAERGVIVDFEGYFVGAVQWEKGTPPPKLFKPRKKELLPPELKTHLLRSDAALAVPSEKARWNFDVEDWDMPETAVWVVEEKSGRLVSKQVVWLERLRLLPAGLIYVDVEPPKHNGRKPVWCGDKWKWPHRVMLIDARGTVENIVLESPKAGAAKIKAPPKGERFDDTAKGKPFPTFTNGDPVNIGDKKDAKGEFVKPVLAEP